MSAESAAPRTAASRSLMHEAITGKAFDGVHTPRPWRPSRNASSCSDSARVRTCLAVTPCSSSTENTREGGNRTVERRSKSRACSRNMGLASPRRTRSVARSAWASLSVRCVPWALSTSMSVLSSSMHRSATLVCLSSTRTHAYLMSTSDCARTGALGALAR